MQKSLFISFEGIEGSGKSTQIQRLKSELEALKFTVSVFREPGGTLFGEKLRSAILESDAPIAPLAEAMLFASSRAQLLSQEILPKLKEEKHVVIVDRYIDSSMAYQGTARELGQELIESIHSHHPLNTRPDITFYLKIDVETSFKRQEKRGQDKDYFEKEKQSFYSKLIQGYDECAKKHSRIKIIDGTKDQENIFQDIKMSLKEYIN